MAFNNSRERFTEEPLRVPCDCCFMNRGNLKDEMIKKKLFFQGGRGGERQEKLEDMVN